MLTSTHKSERPLNTPCAIFCQYMAILHLARDDLALLLTRQQTYIDSRLFQYFMTHSTTIVRCTTHFTANTPNNPTFLLPAVVEVGAAFFILNQIWWSPFVQICIYLDSNYTFLSSLQDWAQNKQWKSILSNVAFTSQREAGNLRNLFLFLGCWVSVWTNV